MIKMKTRDMIALIAILDKFKKFDRDLINLIYNYSFKDFSSILNKVIKEESTQDYRYILAKKFYNKHYNTINTINIYTDIEEFINNNYIGSNPSIRGDVLLMYDELIKYKDIDVLIMKLLQHIQSLGIDYVVLNPSLDNAQEKRIDIDYENNSEIDYFCNMSYFSLNDNEIIYGSFDTPYVIHMQDEGCVIEVRNLLLNEKILPEHITKEDTFNHIVFNIKKMEYQNLLEEYTKLHMYESALYSKFAVQKNKISSLSKVEDIEKIREELNNIKISLDRLALIVQESTNKVCSDNEALSKSLGRIN